MLRRTLLLLLPLLAGCFLPSGSPGSTRMAGETVDTWVERLTPDEVTAAWRSIPWRPTLHEGAGDARKVGKPLLLWLMNGHPLGCT